MATPLTAQIIQESRTLWVGEIETWMDEGYLASLFVNTGAVVSVKIIRDKNTGLPSGYGFVEFQNHQIAEQVLSSYNGTQIPGTTKSYRLNWGIFGGGTKTNQLQGGIPIAQLQQQAIVQQAGAQAGMQAGMGVGAQAGARIPQQDYSIYVGDLDPHVTDIDLLQFFKVKYTTVVGAKCIIDPITKYSKGYGFVKFQNFEESQRAIQECNGQVLKGRHLKTSQSFWKSAQAQEATGYVASTTGVVAGVDQTQQAYLQNPQYLQYYQQLYQGVNPYVDQNAATLQYTTSAQGQQYTQVDQNAFYQQQLAQQYPQYATQQQYGQQQVLTNGVTQQYQVQGMEQQIQGANLYQSSAQTIQANPLTQLLENKHELLKKSDQQISSTNYNIANKTFLENNYEFTNCKVSVDLLYYHLR